MTLAVAPGSAEGEKVIAAAISTAWDTMMPLDTTSNFTRMVMDQIYDRLAQSKANGDIEPRLASSWTVNDASDAVTFHLNESAIHIAISARICYNGTGENTS